MLQTVRRARDTGPEGIAAGCDSAQLLGQDWRNPGRGEADDQVGSLANAAVSKNRRQAGSIPGAEYEGIDEVRLNWRVKQQKESG